MKVVFVNGLFGEKRYSEPLGISYLYAVLEKANIESLDVEIFDPCIEGNTIQESVKKVFVLQADIIALSFISDASDVCKIFIDSYLLLNKNIKFIIGGHGPSLLPEKFLYTNVDAVFIGESENNIVPYFEACQKNQNLRHVPGLVYYDSENVLVRTEPVQIVDDLDQLPFMDRGVLSKLIQKYDSSASARILSSRGCYMKCEYCSIDTYSKLQKGKKYRQRSVSSILTEMKQLYQSFGVSEFLFEDDNFLPPGKMNARKKIDEFCDGLSLINIPNIKLHLQFRPDDFDAYAVKKLIEYGLCDIFIGVESVVDSDMRFFGRNSDAEKNVEVMDELYKLGFSCNVNSKLRLRIGYIIFNPESTRESLISSIAFLKKYEVTPKKLINSLRPYPKTKIQNKFLERGYINDDQSINYLHGDIQQIQDLSNVLIKKVLGIREKIRLPIKIVNEQNITDYTKNESLKQLDTYRKKCDELCYEILSKLLAVNHEEIQYCATQYNSIIDDLLEEIEYKLDIRLIKKNLEIEEYEYGIYR